MKIGIIGGSGLEDPKLMQNIQEVQVETPYGEPSSKVLCGKIQDIDICIISRHGKRHEIPPTQVNNKANVYALKKLGVTHILATTAVGSLKERMKRGDFVILDQFIDFTKQRIESFYDKFVDKPMHASLADPFSEFLRNKMIEACEELGLSFHRKGTVLTIEGPRFSTRAESLMFQKFADLVNMSIAPEAILAREAGLEYASVAMVTDYDCWKQDEEPVTWQEILEIFEINAEKVKRLLIKVIEKLALEEISKKDIEFIKNKIRTIPDFPKQGVQFRDVTTLLGNKEGFEKVLEIFEKRYREREIDIIAGIESRGFIIAGALASRLKKPIAVIRKPGKLPYETVKEEYELEYGKDSIEIHKDAVKKGEKVLIIDDLLATGGTMEAACKLIERLGGEIEECAFIIDLPDLHGKQKLLEQGRKVFNIVSFEGG